MNKRILSAALCLLFGLAASATLPAPVGEALGLTQDGGTPEPIETQLAPVPNDEQLSMPHAVQAPSTSAPAAPTGCSTYSYGGIVLLEHANCEGNGLAFTGATGLVNLTDYGWNDRASSVYVPSGWSLKVYEHTNGQGASRCLSWTMWDFNLDYFDNSSVRMNDAISSAQAFINGTCGAPDLRQNGAIRISGDLVEGGEVRLTIPVKNFGSANSPAMHVYTEGYTARGDLWRADGAQPTAVVLGPGQSVDITVRHALWGGHAGWWNTYGVYIWNDSTGGYYGPLAANGYDQSVDFYVEPAPSCANFSSSGIVLFEHANCSGAQLTFNGASSRVNLDAYGWNDRASSIYVPSGWSLRVYEHNDGGGASRCLSWTMWDFNLDYFDNSSVRINDAISSAQAFTNGTCGAPDLRQNGAIRITGNLVEGGEVRLTIPVKNFGSANSPAMHVYTEGYTANGDLWRADGAQPTAVVLGPGQSTEITVRHALWGSHAGWWNTYGVFIWNDSSGNYYGPLAANGYDQNVEFYVEQAPSCANFSHSGIVLFEHANCSGNQLIFNGASSRVNLSSYSWNDRASSVYIPSGWSLLVYEHNDGGGASRCLTGVMWDFNLDYFDNSSVKINDAISSAQAFTNNSCTSPGSFDLRQNGAIEVSGNLVEGGTVFLTIPVKNFGNAATPAVHVYVEGHTANGDLWRADAAQPTAVIIQPNQTVSFRVEHSLWYGHAGNWTSYGVYVWNDSAGSYQAPLPANGYNQAVSFNVDPFSSQGGLQLHMPDSLPSNSSVRPTVTINHQGGSTNYRVETELWRGFSKIGEQSRDFNFATSGSQQHTFDFRAQEPGNYYVWAELWRGDTKVAVETRSFVIGADYLQLWAAASDLTNSAHNELNQGEDIAVNTLTKGVLASTAEAASFLIEKVVQIGLKLSEVAELADMGVPEAVEKITDKLTKYQEALHLGTESSVRSFWRADLEDTYGRLRQEADQARDELLDDAAGRAFTWNNAWQAEVLRRQLAIENVNELRREGLWLALDAKPPFVHRASLTEMQGGVDWIVDDLLPTLGTITVAILILFLAVGLIILVILSLPVSLPASLAGGAVVIGKAMLVVYPVLKALLAMLGTATVVIALSVVTLLAIGVGGAAEDIFAPIVVDEHGDAISYLSDRIAGGSAPSGAAPGLAVEVKGGVVAYSLEVLGAAADAAAPTSLQLFRGDGEIVAYADVKPGSAGEVIGHWNLPAGRYWAVAATHGSAAVAAVRQDFEVLAAQVSIELALSNHQPAAGTSIDAELTLTNQDGSNSTGTFVVNLMALDDQLSETWLVSLAPSESRTFEASFTPAAAGAGLVRASAANDLGNVLAIADEPFVVGDGPAFAINGWHPSTFAPGQAIEWAMTAANRGTQSGPLQLTVETYDISHGYALVHNTSQAITLQAGQTSAFAVNPLNEALPGQYETHFYLDGVLYRADRYTVEADGALFAVVRADPLLMAIGSPVNLVVQVQDESYNQASAALALWVLEPDGDRVEVALAPAANGEWVASFVPTVSGTYVTELVIHKEGYAASANSAFFLAEEASLLVQSEPALLALSSEPTKNGLASFTIANEYGVPIANAAVTIVTSYGIVTGQTDSAGWVSLYVPPEMNETVLVQVDKPGFASTTLHLTVAAEHRVLLPIVFRGE